MAKVAFSKLGLKKNEETSIVKFNDLDIEVKKYLPVTEKMAIVQSVLNNTMDQNSFINPTKVEVYTVLEIIYNYTNITFTEKQKEDVAKLYDLLETNGVIDVIISAIPKVEYDNLLKFIDTTLKSFYDYKNSVMGILEQVSADYRDMDFNAADIQQKISDPANLALLKDIMTKLG